MVELKTLLFLNQNLTMNVFINRERRYGFFLWRILLPKRRIWNRNFSKGIVNYYQGLICVLRWICELGRVILLAQTRVGQLEQAYHTFAYYAIFPIWACFWWYPTRCKGGYHLVNIIVGGDLQRFLPRESIVLVFGLCFGYCCPSIRINCLYLYPSVMDTCRAWHWTSLISVERDWSYTTRSLNPTRSRSRWHALVMNSLV